MDTLRSEAIVKDIVARQARADVAQLNMQGWGNNIGIDSLGLLVLRENLERVLTICIPDDVWLGFNSVDDVIAYAQKQSNGNNATPHFAAAPLVEVMASRPSTAREPGITRDGLYVDDIEIGMPLTGLMNLAESPLLKHAGNMRWQHLSSVCNVPSKLIADEEGARLYATFFYVEMAFPEKRPLGSYGENDRLRLVSTMERFGGSMLDGLVFLLPADTSVPAHVPYDCVTSAVAAGVPAVRLSNIFVKQFGGAEWLKKSRPVNPGFERITEAAIAPDSYTIVKQAEKDGYFALPPAHYLPLTNGAVTVEYALVPDRDLNGAGLVYFANYPLFLDIAEREVLSEGQYALPTELINRRTLVRRRSAYLNNASSQDKLLIEVEAWLENPIAAGSPAPEMAPIRLWLNYRMRRRSDGRLMMVSTAEKLIFGSACEELPFFLKIS